MLSLKWLDEEIARAKENERESFKGSPNSYGAGYDSGYSDALISVRRKLTGEE